MGRLLVLVLAIGSPTRSRHYLKVAHSNDLLNFLYLPRTSCCRWYLGGYYFPSHPLLCLYGYAFSLVYFLLSRVEAMRRSFTATSPPKPLVAIGLVSIFTIFAHEYRIPLTRFLRRIGVIEPEVNALGVAGAGHIPEEVLLESEKRGSVSIEASKADLMKDENSL